MIVASFFAPRFTQWVNCDYDKLLMLLDKSCHKLDIKHMVISDELRPHPLQTYLTYLPENLMQAFLYGQMRMLKEIDEPILFVGADCLIIRSPELYFSKDLAITTSDTFSDCKMNTGAIFCNNNLACAEIWAKAYEFMPIHWGDDQRCLYRAIKESNLDVEELKCEDHNWAPDSINDSAGMPTVVHFRGPRKSFMSEWAKKYLNIMV